MRDLLPNCEDSVDRVSVRDQILQRAHMLYKTTARQVSGHFTAQTSGQLWVQTLPFTHGQGPDGMVIDFDLWPFVELVTYVIEATPQLLANIDSIGGNFIIIEQNIRIADTPGLVASASLS
jgi:hypothetical protein